MRAQPAMGQAARPKAHPLLRALLCAALPLAAALPAHAGLFSDDEARQALIDLRSRYEKSEQARVNKEAELTSRVEQLQRSLLDLNNQIERLRIELAQQQGSNEVLTRDLSDIQRRQKDLQQGVDERVAKLEPQKVTLDGKEFLADAEEKRQYEESMARLKASDFDGASAGLAAFVKRWPASGYRETALYWLGNAYYGRGAYKEAIATFRTLLSVSPDHARAPEALLSIANCQIELKDQKAARRTLGDLVKAYPKSEAAQAARDRLGGRT